jgi:hypothetical protein
MIVSINQPAYLPWLGYFERIARSDVHVVLDHVQFEKASLTNRNKVRTKDGWTWLSVPVRTASRFGRLEIDGLEIDTSQRWAHRHWQTLRTNYARAANFAQHADYWEDVYRKPWSRLVELLLETLTWSLRAFEISTPIVRSSKLELSSTKGELVLEICRQMKADRYLSGPLGRNYLEPTDFERAGIDLCYHEHVPPTYAQCYPGFEPGLAAIDAVFNLGAATAGGLICR